jgi:hypothetical protein
MNTSTEQMFTGICPSWIEALNEIHDVLGFSWARVAYRIGCSPSSIQKLVNNHQRSPRDRSFFHLCCFYYKLFYGVFRSEKAAKHVEKTNDQTLCALVIELAKRGLLEKRLKGNREENFQGLLGKEIKNMAALCFAPQSASHIIESNLHQKI